MAGDDRTEDVLVIRDTIHADLKVLYERVIEVTAEVFGKKKGDLFLDGIYMGVLLGLRYQRQAVVMAATIDYARHPDFGRMMEGAAEDLRDVIEEHIESSKREERTISRAEAEAMVPDINLTPKPPRHDA